MSRLRGAKLPNGDLLVCGGWVYGGMYGYMWTSDEYIVFKQGSNQWKKVGTMKRARTHHSSTYINGNLLTVGGIGSSSNAISHHEQFSFEGGIKERKEMPIALYGHTATIFNYHKMLICGGRDIKVQKQLMSHRNNNDRIFYC